MKSITISTLAWAILVVIVYSCSAGGDKKNAPGNASSEKRPPTEDSLTSRSSETIRIPAATGKNALAEAIAKSTALRDSIDAVIGNMQATVNYDTLRANGTLNFFNASISEMRLAKNRISLDLDKVVIKDLDKSADKLSAVTGKMRERKDELNKFSQRIEKIAGSIKSLVDITSFLAINGYISRLR